ncbi:MAG: phenylacetate--CoA ligase family protein [Chloroflexia bacterium]|nr:phenylacetate--CoA ligase family protein [Chloroflexia bacterium]
MVNKDDHVKILISNRTENSLGSLLKEGISKLGANAEIVGTINTVEKAIKVSINADCLVGMPAELLYMSKKAPFLRPKSVLLAADYIPQSIIGSIKDTWKCEVYSHYGHTEFGYGCAVDCKFNHGLHLRDAHFIFEIIDPETGIPVKQGEKGEIVITTLSNEAMPLIRYRTGNISSFVTEACKCGGNLHRFSRLDGRYESVISLGNGKSISIHQLDELLFANKSVSGFEACLIKESGKTTLLLKIESSQNIDEEIFLKILPDEVDLKIEYGSFDPFKNRGKRRIKIINEQKEN